MNQEANHQLFVYGTLRSGFGSAAYEYISRYFFLVGHARVRGKLFDLGSYPGGIACSEANFISGELYSIKNVSEFAWVIEQLDDYEGVSATPGEIQLYKRELTDVYINHTVTPAWIYWYAGSIKNKPLIESGDMIQYLQQKK